MTMAHFEAIKRALIIAVYNQHDEAALAIWDNLLRIEEVERARTRVTPWRATAQDALFEALRMGASNGSSTVLHILDKVDVTFK